MSEQSRQYVVVNRAGTGGNIGAESVPRAAPDARTLLIGTTALAISPSLYRKLADEVTRDLAPITTLTTSPSALAVHPLRSRSVRPALIALAKRQLVQSVHTAAVDGLRGTEVREIM